MSIQHQILGVPPGASASEIREAYRKLARKYHPDVSTIPDAGERFIEITEAYEKLTKPRGPEASGQPQHQSYDDLRRERARAYAHMSYEKFRQENDAFRQSWYYKPVKTGTQILISAVYLLSFFFFLLAVYFFTRLHIGGIIGGLFLAGIGTRVFFYAREIQHESKEYFPEE